MQINVRGCTLGKLVVWDNPTLKKFITHKKTRYDFQVIFVQTLNKPKLSNRI